MATEATAAEQAWPQRTWILVALGMIVAIFVQQLLDLPDSNWEWGRRLVSALVLFLGVGGLGLALSWKPGLHVPAICVALLCGLVSGGVLIWNGMPIEHQGFWSWQLFCGLVGSGFILTLFQAAQDRHPHLPERWNRSGIVAWKRRALDYGDVHQTIWVDALLLGASLAFTLICFVVTAMLAKMFTLVKIDLLHQLMQKHWFEALLAGAALGGAIGMLRDRTAIIGALQKVGMTVLRVLAPVLGVGIVLFLIALLFTGLSPLWATGETTPLMLSGAIVSLFLVNAVIGQREEDASPAQVLRWGAMALALVMLPLVLIAAWSTSLRIGQHGLSPDRMWALTFIILGTVTAVAYAVAILRRGDWIARLYRSNLHLAFILGGVAILLSTPLLGFERIATSDQLARLESGRIKPLDFDYRGLWFDFGPPGRAAVKRLAKEATDASVREFAAKAQKLETRYEEAPNSVAQHSGDELDNRLTILPNKVPLEPKLREQLIDYKACGSDGPCLVHFVPGHDFAVAIKLPSPNCKDCAPSEPDVLLRGNGDWIAGSEESVGFTRMTQRTPKTNQSRLQAIRAGKVEMRAVPGRQLFIDGKPYGDIIPSEDVAKP